MWINVWLILWLLAWMAALLPELEGETKATKIVRDSGQVLIVISIIFMIIYFFKTSFMEEYEIIFNIRQK